MWYCGEHSDSERKEELASYIIVHGLQRPLCEVWQPPRVAKWREGRRVTGAFQRLTIAKIAFAKVTSRICNANATPLFVRDQTSMPEQIGITDFHYDRSYIHMA